MRSGTAFGTMSEGRAGSSAAASPPGAHGCRRFEGKVAVVTGSTAGIGQAIVERLGLEGAKGVAELFLHLSSVWHCSCNETT